MGYSASEIFFTTKELAARWHCDKKRIYALIAEGKLESVKRDLGTDGDRKRRRKLQKDEPEEERKRNLIPFSAIRAYEERWHRTGDERSINMPVDSSSATARKRGRPSKGVSSPSW